MKPRSRTYIFRCFFEYKDKKWSKRPLPAKVYYQIKKKFGLDINTYYPMKHVEEGHIMIVGMLLIIYKKTTKNREWALNLRDEMMKLGHFKHIMLDVMIDIDRFELLKY